MSEFSLSRRRVFLGLAGLSAGIAAPAAARQDKPPRVWGDLKDLQWSESTAASLWKQPGGPQFELIDTIDMMYESKVRPAPPQPLSAAVVAETKKALAAASAFYRSKGMGAPNLPIRNGKFHVAFLSQMGDVNGATGEAVGIYEVLDNPFVTAPVGIYLMMNTDNYLNPEPEHPWAPRTTLAHEMLHAIDTYMVKDNDWASIGKWWREGNVEAVAQHAFGNIGYNPLELLKPGGRPHAQNVGMRPYDYPLTLKGVPSHRPDWVRRGAAIGPDEPAAAKSFFASNATYFTSSFWRYLLKEEAPARVSTQYGTVPLPGNFELMAPLRRHRITAEDRAKGGANGYMDAGIPALDRFLKKHHPTWGATGLYRAFPAFIAHFVEWPDQVIKSRQGLFAHPKWLDVMFMEGVPKREISIDKDITIELKIPPLAAKAIRFEIPTDLLDVGCPITITASVLDSGGQSDPIENIHIGLRGQCLGNGSASQKMRYQSGRVRRWVGVKATPLKRREVNDETILTIINVAPDPSTTMPVKIRLNVSLQVASTVDDFSYHPKPVETPDGRTVHIPPSTAPKDPAPFAIVPVQREADATRLTIIKDADVTRMITGMVDITSSMSLKRETDEAESPPPTPATIAAKMAGGQIQPVRVELEMPRIEPGHLGGVSGAKVAAEWTEPRYAPFAELGVSQNVRIETDAVQVQITSSTEGTMLGTFSADFNQGSQNEDGIFRGRIEGRFSLGIVRDTEGEEGEEILKNPTAVFPTDFFVIAARAGQDTASMQQAFNNAAGNLTGQSGGGAAGSGSIGSMGGGGLAETCSPPVTRQDFDAFFKARYGTLPGIEASDLAEARAGLLENWELTKGMVCDWKLGL